MTDDRAIPQTPSQRHRKLLLLRVALLSAVIVPAVVAVSAWVITRSWFIILMTAPGLQEKLGGEITIGNAAYRGDGTLIYQDIVLRTKTAAEEAAQALSIARAEVALDLRNLLTEGVKIRRVVLDGVLLRISEDARNPGNFNFADLDPDWTAARPSDEPILPPSVRINSAVIEMGSHVDASYRAVGRRRFSGEMYPDTEGDGWYRFHLQELDTNDVSLGEDGLLIDGRWNVETMEHKAQITGVVLDERTYSMCPQMARLWWQRMQPEGPVGTAVIEWREGEDFVAELQIDRMALNIPVAAQEFSASYQRGEAEVEPPPVASLPRMHVHSGVVRLKGNQLTLDNLIGEFGTNGVRTDLMSMPYRVNLSIHDLPSFDWDNQHDWMERVLATAPFEMSIRMENFSLTHEPASAPPAVELPRQVADTLSKFNLTGWSLSTMVEITRETPRLDAAGAPVAAPIRTKGQAYISDASGAFEGFPYPIDDVDAFVEFDSEQITLHYLTAVGSGESTLRMSGTIAPPGQDAAISLRLTARNLPLDEQFRQGLKGGQLSTFDVMLHRPSYESLANQGLLPDLDDIDAARQLWQRKTHELKALGEDAVVEDLDGKRRLLKREIARLGTLIEAGPFELGGTVDLDLAIERPRGLDTKPVITGTVDIHRAGMVYGRFPYPIYVLGGKLIVEPDRVTIDPGRDGAGIPIATPGGGRGTVIGEVKLVRGDSDTAVLPDLEIDLRGDYLSDLLYAAMPLTDEERAATPPHAARSGTKRSLIARLLEGAGLRGWLNHTGYISAAPDGRPVYDFAVELYDGKAEPTAELFETMRELGLPSPTGVSLDDVNALLQITSTTIRLADFVGSRGSARITANAMVDLEADPIETELTIEFDDLELERYMIDLTPGYRQRTAALWDRYQPQGLYDAKLTYHAFGSESKGAEVSIWPQELRILIDDQPVWLICDRGEIKAHRDRIAFEEFVIDVRGNERDEGLIVLDGSYGLAAQDKGLELTGSWTGGELGSPLITETLRLIGAEHNLDRYRSFAPTGSFDAEFSFTTQPGGSRDYEFTVKPDTIGLRVEDTQIYADLDPGAEISFTPGRIVLRNVAGEHAGGRFKIDGGIDVADGIDADLDIAYTGRIDSPQLVVTLPKAVRSMIETLEVSGAEPVSLTDARLRITQVDLGDGKTGWDSDFSGLLETRGASLKIGGIELTELDGLFDVAAATDPDSGTSLDIKIMASRTLAKNRELTNVEGTVKLTDGGRVIRVPSIRADVYGGVVSGFVIVGLDPGSEYKAAFDLGAVSLAGFTAARTGDEIANRPRQDDGKIYGAFRLSGRSGMPETRRGRGALRVAWGKMADMPLALRVLQLFELMPPLMGNLDFAAAEAYIDGDRLVFERLFLECPTLQLIGEGEMSFPGMELDVRFRTKGTVPLWGDLVAGLSDQLFLVRVTGPLDDPQTKLIPLPGLGQGKPPRKGKPDAAAQTQAVYAEEK